MNDLPVPEYAAIRHILTSPPLAQRTAAHIGPDDFDWSALLRETETMSGGEGVLIRIAYDLWHAEGIVGIWELPRRLDRSALNRVFEAFQLCRGRLSVPTAQLLRDAA